MGIKMLNRYLRENTGNNIKKIHLSEMYGKKIAIDTSIFMYKYASTDSLIENMYLMLSVFRYYYIIPIFIFDGKPPHEKKELLLQRKKEKIEAEKEYNCLKLQLNNYMEDFEKQEIINSMDILKKKFIHIHKSEIENVKNLIRSYGATYYDAPGEADQLCALLTIKGKVWACLSEDMDMFVYGCPRVIRYLSLLNHNAILYEMKEILETLNMNQDEFREICVLSGTDYNLLEDNSPNIYLAFNYFNKYKKIKCKKNFYEWLIENSNYNIDHELLVKICNLFDLKNQINIKKFECIKILNGPIIKKEIQEILELNGFIFPLKK